MKKQLIVALSISALSLVALTGCSSATDSAATSAAPSESAAPTTQASTALSVASSGLGEIIVDGKGLTAYTFAKDVAGSGTSACVDECATVWPAITTDSAAPKVSGVTGEIATIKTVTGGNQITVNGLPIYTFSKDAAPGDTNGQLFKDVWFALTPAGAQISTPNAQ